MRCQLILTKQSSLWELKLPGASVYPLRSRNRADLFKRAVAVVKVNDGSVVVVRGDGAETIVRFTSSLAAVEGPEAEELIRLLDQS